METIAQRNVRRFVSFVFGMLATLLILGSLVGCGHTEVKTVTTTVYKPIVTPKTLLEPLEPTTPPDASVYVASSPREKENLLIEYAKDLLGVIEKLNNRLVSIGDFQDKEVKNVKDLNK